MITWAVCWLASKYESVTQLMIYIALFCDCFIAFHIAEIWE